MTGNGLSAFVINFSNFGLCDRRKRLPVGGVFTKKQRRPQAAGVGGEFGEPLAIQSMPGPFKDVGRGTIGIDGNQEAALFIELQ